MREPDYAVPETPETLAIQRQELKDGKRDVMVYKGGLGPQPPAGMSSMRHGIDTYHYNPDAHSENSIRGAIANDTIGQHLRLGDTTKNEAMADAAAGHTPMAIVERTPEGHEVRAAAGTRKTAKGQFEHFVDTKEPQNRVKLENPLKTIAKRQM
jgi:hypothetical protein